MKCLTYVIGFAFLITLAVALIPAVGATTYDCDSCSECNALISSAIPGDTIRLNTPLSLASGTCIAVYSATNLTFDCQGNTITSAGYDADGIVVSFSTGVSVLDCIVSGFNFGFHDYSNVFTTWSNSTASGNYYGISMGESDSTRILSSAFNYNVYYGTDIQTSSNVLLSNVTAYGNGLSGVGVAYETGITVIEDTISYSNGQNGFGFWSVQNMILRNITSNGNAEYGVYFDGGSINNAVEHSTIVGNGLYGLVFGTTDGNSENNLFSDNILNNSQNVFFADDTVPQVWNVTRVLGINIFGGSHIGGNYWALPDGTGFSDICIDFDYDGICDSQYDIGGVNVDYLPLSNISSFNVSQDIVSLYYPPYGKIGDNITIYAVVRKLGAVVQNATVSITLDSFTAGMSWDNVSGSYIVYWIPSLNGIYNFTVMSLDGDGIAVSNGSIAITNSYQVCISIWTDVNMTAGSEYKNEFAWIFGTYQPGTQTLHTIFEAGKKYACPPEASYECMWHAQYVNGTACVDLFMPGNYTFWLIGNNIEWKQNIGSGFIVDCDFCEYNAIDKHLLLNLGTYTFNGNMDEDFDLYQNPAELYYGGAFFGFLASWAFIIIYAIIGFVAFIFTLYATGSVKSALAVMILLPVIMHGILMYSGAFP